MAGAREQAIEMRDKADELAQQVQGAREQAKAEVRSNERPVWFFRLCVGLPESIRLVAGCRACGGVS